MDSNEGVSFNLTTQKNIDMWLNGHYDDQTKSEIHELLKNNPKQLIDAFYTNLTFGTAGLRGLMGVGMNRINIYTVRAASQGLANYILKQPKLKNDAHAILIGYDSRHHSRTFAEETALVMAGNGIQVYLFKNIRPTPLVSFGCRYKKCLSAIMITASHNPADYNGYKVYWSDGGQIVPPDDQGIIDEVTKITDPLMVKQATSIHDPLIQEVEEEIDEAYLKAIIPLQCYPTINQNDGHRLKTVYTSLHGTGITIAPRAFKAWGFSEPLFVEKQIIPDGDFPTVAFPNPEERSALQMGIDLLLQSQSDILIANDPDADRVGIAILHQGQAVTLNGNQIAALCLEHICHALTIQNRLPEKAAFIKTVVTTELFKTICQAYDRPCFDVLTGFKYIAEKIREWESQPNGYQYIFGGEESYGYLLGTYARDKDAIIISTLLCEMALQAKLENKTLIDKLHDLYAKYGMYCEKVLALNFGETKEGREQMKQSMEQLRHTPPKAINGVAVQTIEDYQILTKYEIASGHTEPLLFTRSDILIYWLEDHSKIMIRPSGTEPKVKIYGGVIEKNFTDIENGMIIGLKRCEEFLLAMKNHVLPTV
jgi:phosphoglucomutase/phosphomannomutase